MKLIHLSDLHIGKRVNEFSMLEDQAYILTKILNIIDAEKPDGVIFAGDIYDKSVPNAEDVLLFDDFLVRLSTRKLQIFVISGNHDSSQRIAFGARLMHQSGVYMAPVYDGNIVPCSIEDQFGVVDIFMLSFIKPSYVKRYYADAQIESYTDAVRIAIENMPINPANRNILVTHQFVTGAACCESENVSVGGSDNVDASVFEPFDYVALGHLHGPQNIGKPTVRYCGSPLKYSFSEANQIKSVTIVELGEKGKTVVRTVELVPQRNMCEIKGNYQQVTAKSFYEGTTYQNDYMHITLTDEDDIPDAIGKLRTIYPNIMKLDYDNKRTRSNTQINGTEAVEQKNPLELFSEFFEQQNNQSLSDIQRQFTANLIEKIWEEQK